MLPELAARAAEPVTVTGMAARGFFDDRRCPKVHITWPSEPVNDKDFMRLIDRISGHTARAQPYVILHDARNTARPSLDTNRKARATCHA